MLDGHIGRGVGFACVMLILEDLEFDPAIGMLETDEALTEAHARLARRNAILVEMLDPPFERTLRDRIGADGELVRSLAPLLARAARREGRHHRAGGAELVREIEMVDGSAAVVEQRSAEQTSELQSLMRISYAVFCLKQKKETQR